MAVNASVLIAREGNTTVMKMSHVPKYFYVVYVYSIRFACIPDLPYTSWVTKVSVPIKIINIGACGETAHTYLSSSFAFGGVSKLKADSVLT